MKLYGGTGLHSDNDVVAIKTAANKLARACCGGDTNSMETKMRND